MIKRLFICCAAFGFMATPQAQAAAPYQAVSTIAAGATSVVWDVPAVTYGPLLSLQALGLTNAATLKVDHIIAVTSAISITNAVETAAAGATLLVYPERYLDPQRYVTNDVILTTSPAKPILLVPGDKLLFTVSAENGGSAGRIVIRAGFPGK